LSADEELEAFSAGGKTLSSDASHLYDAIRLLDGALSARIARLDGSAFATNMVALWRFGSARSSPPTSCWSLKGGAGRRLPPRYRNLTAHTERPR
jgi:hypothetical protein